MSDEQLRTRITLLMQDVGWGIEGSYCIDEDAVVRILKEHDAALESQNQALQKELATTQEAYRFKSREADANGREVENKAAILNAIEALLDVDDEHTGWDRIVALQGEVERLKAREMPTLQRKGVATASGTTSDNAALQERAEKAEARLQLAEDALAMYQAGAVTHISIESRPTQETDPG